MEWITSTQLLKELESSNDGDAWQHFCTFFQPMLVNFAKKLDPLWAQFLYFTRWTEKSIIPLTSEQIKCKTTQPGDSRGLA